MALLVSSRHLAYVAMYIEYVSINVNYIILHFLISFHRLRLNTCMKQILSKWAGKTRIDKKKHATTEIVRNIIIAVYVISLSISANDLQDAILCYISLIGMCNGCMSTKRNKSTMYEWPPMYFLPCTQNTTDQPVWSCMTNQNSAENILIKRHPCNPYLYKTIWAPHPPTPTPTPTPPTPTPTPTPTPSPTNML